VVATGILFMAVWHGRALTGQFWTRTATADRVPNFDPEKDVPLLDVTMKPVIAGVVEKFRSVPLKRASDYFHRWRLDAQFGTYSVNPQLRAEMNHVLRRDEFKRTFPLSRPLVYRSPFGWEVRQRMLSQPRQPEFEYHVDQFLAACAEVEAPLNLSIETESGAVTLGELLDASRLNFEKGQEGYWTLVAYCAYRPNETHWRNRFGEPCSYETMVEEILSQPLDEGSCGGTHKQYALAYLLSQPTVADLLPVDLQCRCKDYLRLSSDALRHSQLPNGAWSPAWAQDEIFNQSGPLVFTKADLVRITGHHLEWIGMAPPKVCPPQSSVATAIRFLAGELNRAKISTIQGDYCAYSHAACVLARIGSRSVQPEDAREAVLSPADKRLRAGPALSQPPSRAQELMREGFGPGRRRTNRPEVSVINTATSTTIAPR
jgi:hypothetical protein